MAYRIAILLGLLLWCQQASATNVQLNLTTSDPNQVSGTWTVTTTLSDLQSLGIASFSIDVDGMAGVVNNAIALKADVASQTLQVSNPPYSLFRTPGTVTSPNVTGIGASQDTVSAIINNDPSILRFGDGNTGMVHSATYGDIAGNGPSVLATGSWTTAGIGGSLQAILTPGSSFNLFPLNYAVDDGTNAIDPDTGQHYPPPSGTTATTVAANNVIPSAIVPMPAFQEPPSIVLMGIAGLGLVGFASRLF